MSGDFNIRPRAGAQPTPNGYNPDLALNTKGSESPTPNPLTNTQNNVDQVDIRAWTVGNTNAAVNIAQSKITPVNVQALVAAVAQLSPQEALGGLSPTVREMLTRNDNPFKTIVDGEVPLSGNGLFMNNFMKRIT